MKASIGFIGLAVMGENLALNLARNGYTVAVYNRTTSRVDEFLQERGKGKSFIGTHSLQELVSVLQSPRIVFLMVKAGDPVDQMINQLLPILSPGDIIIDGGNSYYKDTERRVKTVEAKGLQYIGTGVSGGEEGALWGPSIMPGGSIGAWKTVKPILQAIAAKASGKPCCDWIGPGGAGHYVKMVHNGIEYGDMELISEIYAIMKRYLQMDYHDMESCFRIWNNGNLNSYLMEITADILGFKDADGSPLVEKILDTAGQKGTGKWTSEDALDRGVPLTLITEAVFARSLSDQKEARIQASQVYPQDIFSFQGDRQVFLADLHDGLYAAKIISYTQGFELLRKAGTTNDWNLDLGNIALLWRGGCIIRSSFLDKISDAYHTHPDLENLILAPAFQDSLHRGVQGLRKVLSTTLLAGIPTPALSAALSWFDGYRSAWLPANLIQAQRDYFGAHTYERTDTERGSFFHTNWTGHGGTTASTTYNA